MRHTMSTIERAKALLGLGTDEQDPLEQLRDLLAEREAELSLTATYGRPEPNLTDEPTVVFPYTLHTGDGEEYGTGAKEFVLPDDGLDDADAPLTKFVGKRHGIGPADVDFDALASVEGTSASATLNESGDVQVEARASPDSTDSGASAEEVEA